MRSTSSILELLTGSGVPCPLCPGLEAGRVLGSGLLNEHSRPLELLDRSTVSLSQLDIAILANSEKRILAFGSESTFSVALELDGSTGPALPPLEAASSPAEGQRDLRDREDGASSDDRIHID